MYAFSRDQRLRGAATFKKVFVGAKKLSYNGLQIYFCEKSLAQTIVQSPTMSRKARLGIVIKKKQVKHAFIRNRLRRIVRESFRLTPYQEALGDLDMIIIVNATKLNAEDALSFRQDVDRLWQKIAQHRQKTCR